MITTPSSARGQMSVQTGLRRNADMFKNWATEIHGMDVLYNREGVRWLGAHINDARDTVTQDYYAREVSLYGSFLGECLCNIYDGTWQRRNDSWVVHCARGTKQLDVFVFDKVEKQIENGTLDSVEGYLEVLDFYLAAGSPIANSKYFS